MSTLGDDLATPHGSTVPPATKPGTLPVVEIFHSIQGEGTRSGEPATFLRFAGCNLRCAWCDTSYSWTSEGVRAANAMTIDQIADEVRESAVVITGGEPMLHRRRLPELIDSLRFRGVQHITVETNATIYDPAVASKVDLWSLSPKLKASGEEPQSDVVDRYLLDALIRTQLKFVITGIDDWLDMWELLERLEGPVSGPILVQPDGTRQDYDVALQELTDIVLADEGDYRGARLRSLVRVTPQVHRVIWGPAARGV